MKMNQILMEHSLKNILKKVFVTKISSLIYIYATLFGSTSDDNDDDWDDEQVVDDKLFLRNG